MNQLSSLLSQLPQTLRSALNCHKYLIMGSGGFRMFRTSKDDLGSVVASILGQWGVTSFSGLSQRLVALGLVAGMMMSGSAFAIPRAANTNFTHGTGTVVDTNANRTDFNISSVRSIFETTDFNTLANQRVNFNFSQANSATLGRISGGPTNFFGNLTANGTVMLVNPAGIVFGAGSTVNVGSLVASTLPMATSSADFMNPLVNNFTFAVDAVTQGDIVNVGQITADDFALLISSAIDNQGTIKTANGSTGSVQLAVGDQVTMATNNGVLVDVTVDQALSDAIVGYNDAIQNSGTIKAHQVALKAKLQNAVYDQVINNTGRIEATKVSDVNGTIVLEAAGGTVENDNLIVSAGDVTITNTTDKINNNAAGTIKSNNGDVTLVANATPGNTTRVGGHAVDNYGLIQAKKGTISTDSAGGTNQYGTGKLDAKNINMQANGQITVDANAEIKASEDITILSRERFLRNSGTIFGKNVSASVAQDVINNGGGLIDASNSLSLTSVSGNVSNSGMIGRNNLTTANISANGNIAGSGQFLAKTLNLTSTTGDIGSLAAPLAIDANTVTLNAQDATNGNAYIADIDDIDLGASNVRGELQLASTGAGSLDVTGVVSGGNILLANVDGDVNVNDALTATSKVDLQSERHTNINANVRAEDGALTINADTDSDGSGNVTIGVGTNNFTKRTATITGENVTNNGDLKAYNLDIDADNKVTTGVGSKFDIGRKVTIDADSVDNNGTIIAKRNNIEITTANELRNDGTLRTTSDDNIILESTAGNVVNTGAVESANNATITAANNVTNSGSVTADNDATVTAGNRFHNQTGGSVVANNALLAEVTDGSLENDGLLKADNGRATVRANSIVNDTTGTIEATNEQLHLETGSPWNSPENGKDVTNRGQLTANTRLKIHAKDDVVNTGDMDAQTIDIFAADAIQITGGSLDATANVNLITGNATTQVEGRDVTISNATVTAGNQVKAQAGDDITITNSTLSGRKIDLAAADNVTTNETVADAQSISGSEFVAINAGNDITLKGDIASSGGSVDVVANSAAEQNKLNNQADITAETTVKLQAGDGVPTFEDGDDLTHNGSIVAGDVVTLMASDDVNGTGDVSGSTITVTAADDATTGGALTAESITVQAADNVTVNGDVTTTSGNLVATADTDADGTGNVVFGDATVDHNIAETADIDGVNVTVNANKLKAKQIDIDATNKVTVAEGTKVTGTQTVNIDGVSVDNNGLVVAKKGDLTVKTTTGELRNDGTFRANSENVVLDGNKVVNNGTVQATKGLVDIDADGAFNSNATSSITGNQGVDIDADSVNAQGAITAENNNVTIDTENNLIVSGDVTSTNNDVLLVSRKGDVRSSKQITAARLARMIAGKDAINSGNINALNATMIAGEKVNNSGTITADNAVSLRSKGTLTAANAAAVRAGDELASVAFQEGDDITNSGTINAGGFVELFANDDVNNTATGSITGTQVTVTTGDDVTNSGALNSTTGDIQIDATGSKVTNSGTMNSANDLNINAGDSATFQDGDDIVNTLTGELLAAKDINLNSGDDITNNGEIRGRNVDIDAADVVSTGSDSKVIARRSLDIDAQSVSNNGRLVARKQDLTVTATTGNVTNNGTMKSRDAAVFVTADQGNVNNQGTVDANKRARLLASQGDVTNGGDITGRNVVLRAKNDVTNQASGTINAINDVDLKAGFGNKFVNGRDIVNNGSIDAGGDVLLRADDDITTGEFSSIDADNVDLIAKDNITINGSVQGIEGNEVVANPQPSNVANVLVPADGGTVTIDAGNNIVVDSTGRVTAGRLVDADAGNNITVNGTVETTANAGNIVVAPVPNPNPSPDRTLAQTTEADVLRDEINLNAGNDITINGRVENKSSKIVIDIDPPVGRPDVSLTRRGRRFIVVDGPNNGQIILNAGDDIQVNEGGRVSAGQIVDGRAGDNITVNGVVETKSSSIFLGDIAQGEAELVAANAVRPPSQDEPFLRGLLERMDRIQLLAKEGDINVNGRVSTGRNFLMDLEQPKGNVGRTQAAFGGMQGYPVRVSEPGVVILTAGNDINVGETGLVSGTNAVVGIAENNINVAGRVESNGSGFPFILNQQPDVAPQLAEGDAIDSPLDEPVMEPGFSFDSIDDGIVLLGAGNDINVESTGIVQAGNLVGAVSLDDINIDGTVRATGGTGFTLPGDLADNISEFLASDELPIDLPSGLTSKVTDQILNGSLLDGDVALIALDNIEVGETGSVDANGNVLGFTFEDDIRNDGSITA